MIDHDLEPLGTYRVIYSCLVGSRGYGLHTPDSDWDYRGAYVPHQGQWYSLNQAPEQIGSVEGGIDMCYWRVDKWFRLLLKANPSVLETLAAPRIHLYDPSGLISSMLENASRFLSRAAHNSYFKYATSQHARILKSLPYYANDPDAWPDDQAFERYHKFRYHTIRLLTAGVHLMNHGEILVNMSAYRDLLVPLRGGTIPLEEYLEIYADLVERFKAAEATSVLPPRPDTEWADDTLRTICHYYDHSPGDS